ncbi:hypothetical protein FQN50_009483 [Emmonsiellopsis sp. PD_5]|nr:hypothetical protein FQN50_009483 [Emmonsiellopsis sp. PD_5]
MAIGTFFPSSSSAAKAGSAQRGAETDDPQNQGNPGWSEVTSDEDKVPLLPSRRGRKRRFVVSDLESEDSAPKRARRPASPARPSKEQSGATSGVKATSGPKDQRPKASPAKGLRTTSGVKATSGPKGQGPKIRPDLGNIRSLTAPRPGTMERTRREARGFLRNPLPSQGRPGLSEGGMTAYVPPPVAEATNKRGSGAEGSEGREEQSQEFSQEDLDDFIAQFGDDIVDVPAAEAEDVEDVGDEERGFSPDDGDLDPKGSNSEGGSHDTWDEGSVPAGEETQPLVQGPILDSACAQVLRKIIVRLVGWANTNNVLEIDHDARVMTLGFWALLRRVSVEYLVGLFLSGIPSEVQALFDKSTWTLKDFLSLPVAVGDKRQGIYGDFATSKDGANCYIGSAKVIHRRIKEHLRIARGFAVQDLPKTEYSKSLHYRQIYRDEVDTHFRLLAAFNHPIPAGYLLLLEGIFMIIFKTYTFPGYVTKWATKPSYDLTKAIRAELNIPSIEWKGMNAAFTLIQGFLNHGARTPSPCKNPECGRMTYHRKAVLPEGERRHARYVADPVNPLGGYHCQICWLQKKRHGALPDKERIEYLVARSDAMALRAAGEILVCSNCKILETQDRRHICHARTNTVLCARCHWYWYSSKFKFKKLPNPKIFDIRERKAQLSQDRQNGVPIFCHNCNAVEGSRNVKGFHVFSTAHIAVMCQGCIRFFHGHDHLPSQDWRQAVDFEEGEVAPPPPVLDAAYVAEQRATLYQDRKDKVKIECANCKAVEGVNCSGKHVFNVRTDSRLCKRCSVYHTKYGKLSDPSLQEENVIRRQFHQELKSASEVLECVNCGKTQPQGLKRPWTFSNEVSGILCYACRAKRRIATREAKAPVEQERARVRALRIEQERARVRALRKAGEPVECIQCTAAENPQAKTKYNINKDPLGPICDYCRDRRFNNPRNLARKRLRERRKRGDTILCHFCSIEEGYMELEIGETCLLPVCPTCKAKGRK